jgi:hypothetical protein
VPDPLEPADALADAGPLEPLADGLLAEGDFA